MPPNLIRKAILLAIASGSMAICGHGIGFLMLNAIVLAMLPFDVIVRTTVFAFGLVLADKAMPSLPDGPLYAFGLFSMIVGTKFFAQPGLFDAEPIWPNRTTRGVLLRVIAIVLCAYLLLDRFSPLCSSIMWIGICSVMAPRMTRAEIRPMFSVALINVGLLLFASAIGVAICEGGSRVLLSAPAPAHSDYLMGDRELRFRNAPGTKVSVPLEHYGEAFDDPNHKESFKISISSLGCRGNEIGPKVTGEFRVFMLGDSFTFGYGVENNETIPAALESALRTVASGRRITVINAGVVGYGPWQEYLLLKQIGFACDPDLIILQTFTNNDISDSLAQNGEVFRAYYLQIVERELAFTYQTYWHVRLQRWLRKYSMFYQQLVRATGRENLMVDMLEQLRGVQPKPKLILPPSESRNPELETELIQYYPRIEAGWSLFENDLKAIAKACNERNVKLMAYCIPGMHMLYDPYWKLYWEPAGTDTIYERGKTLRLMEDVFQRLDIPYVSVLPVLKEEPDPLSLYFRFNKHLTAKGCKSVASTLRDRLRKDFPLWFHDPKTN